MSAFDDILTAIDGYISAIDPTNPRPHMAKFSLMRANLSAIKNTVTQLRAAISMLSAPSLDALLLTGVSFLTATAIAATDNALVALGKLQAQINSIISTKANLASPELTGTPTAPTAAPGTNTDQLSTTAFTQAAIAALVDSSPGTLDTLNELATALGDDPNFATTISTALGLKAPLASPSLTGTPTAPTAATSTNTTQIASTAFVQAVNEIGDLLTINTSTTSYTLTGSDLNTFANGYPVRRMNVSGANNLTIPNDATLGLATPYGQTVNFSCVGAGQTTVVAASGVTATGTPGLKLRSKPSYATALRVAANTWEIFGDLSA